MSRIGPKQKLLFNAIIQSWRNRKSITYDTLTCEKALLILSAAKETGLKGMAKINPSLTRQQAYDILSKGLEGIPPDKPLMHLHAVNIVREFGNDYIKKINREASNETNR